VAIATKSFQRQSNSRHWVVFQEGIGQVNPSAELAGGMRVRAFTYSSFQRSQKRPLELVRRKSNPPGGKALTLKAPPPPPRQRLRPPKRCGRCGQELPKPSHS